MSTITESNKLIAEFMGVLKFSEFLGEEILNLDDGYSMSEARYHTSWDWLMPVVETIRNMEAEYSVKDLHDRYRVAFVYSGTASSNVAGRIISIYDEDYKTATYKAVVEFIQWYNQKNKES